MRWCLYKAHTDGMIEPYTYDANKKHAVVQVQNTSNLIQGAASLTYNAFNKVATVVQGTNTLTITYGPDRQRVKTVLVSGSTTTTTLYAGNYEQRTAGGVTTSYHYVASPDGMIAVYVKKNGTTTPYYVETDHLGSIINLFDASGTKQFSASYDAWGKQTISKNTIGLTRGYTGHEHWNQFGLIDMNGRFYDPLLGRFLSPDPYVQAPDNPQNFNRYAYCLNNPLKYTDPSGESIVGACLVTAAYMYVYGTMANWDSDHPFNPGDWNWKSGSTYTALASGALQGLGIAGVPLGVDGAIPNGLLQSGISVTINGIGNTIDGDSFLDGAAGPAIMGFAGGALSGYMSAQEKGLNPWTGGLTKQQRSIWMAYSHGDISLADATKGLHPDLYVEAGSPDVVATGLDGNSRATTVALDPNGNEIGIVAASKDYESVSSRIKVHNKGLTSGKLFLTTSYHELIHARMFYDGSMHNYYNFLRMNYGTYIPTKLSRSNYYLAGLKIHAERYAYGAQWAKYGIRGQRIKYVDDMWNTIITNGILKNRDGQFLLHTF